MELSPLLSEKGKLSFTITGEGHTFCNWLRYALTKDKSVTKVGYRMENTLVDIAQFFIEGKDPMKSLTEALDTLKKENKDLALSFKKVLTL